MNFTIVVDDGEIVARNTKVDGSLELIIDVPNSEILVVKLADGSEVKFADFTQCNIYAKDEDDSIVIASDSPRAMVEALKNHYA